MATGLLGARHARIDAGTTAGVAALLAARTSHGAALSAITNDDVAATGVTTADQFGTAGAKSTEVVERGGRGDARRRFQSLLGGGITTTTGARIYALDGRAGEPPTGDPLVDTSSNVLEKKRSKGDPQRGWRFHRRKSGGASFGLPWAVMQYLQPDGGFVGRGRGGGDFAFVLCMIHCPLRLASVRPSNTGAIPHLRVRSRYNPTSARDGVHPVGCCESPIHDWPTGRIRSPAGII
jgi:hypothetical protein